MAQTDTHPHLVRVLPRRHTTVNRRFSSWLGAAGNPLRLLFADQSRSPTLHEDLRGEDDRLADLAAKIVLKGAPRVGADQGITLSVIGCGRMGCHIIGELLRRGCSVLMHDARQEAMDRALRVVETMLAEHIRHGMLLPEDQPALLARLSIAYTLEQTVERSALVIEAVYDDAAVKRDLLGQLARACQRAGVRPEDVTFASNTMSKTISPLTSLMPPEYAPRVLGIRFFSPCWFVDDVEVTPQHGHTLDRPGHARGSRQVVQEVAQNACDLLRMLRFEPRQFSGKRWILSDERVTLYARRQQQCCSAEHGAPSNARYRWAAPARASPISSRGSGSEHTATDDESDTTTQPLRSPSSFRSGLGSQYEEALVPSFDPLPDVSKALDAAASADDRLAITREILPVPRPVGVAPDDLADWMESRMMSEGFCVVPGPELTGDAASVASEMVVPDDSRKWRPITNDSHHDIASSRRVVRRLSADELCLKLAFKRRLVELGLQRGRRDVLIEHATEVTDGITALRALADEAHPCPRQLDHCDRAGENLLRVEGIPFAEVPLSVVYALEHRTRFILGGHTIAILKGEMLIFRGDLCHAGAEYTRLNTRLHAYLDPEKAHRDVYIHQCLRSNTPQTRETDLLALEPAGQKPMHEDEWDWLTMPEVPSS